MTAKSKGRSGLWSRLLKRASDPEALANLLADAPSDAATGMPARLGFGITGLAQIALYLLLPAISFLLLHFIFEFRGLLAIFLGAVSILLELAAALPHFDNLNCAVSVSSEGVRLKKVHRSYAIPWWQMKSMDASPDLSLVRLVGSDAQITFSTQGRPREQVVQLLQTIRAHGREYNLELQEMPESQQRMSNLIPAVCHGAAMLVLFIGISQTLPGTLGMRCSVNSAYLQDRYGTPDRQGCVVLRVSAGAADAGVQVGDLLIEFEGVPITSGQQFTYVFEASRKPWDATIIRRGEPEPLHFHIKGGWGKTFQEQEGDPIFYYLRGRWDASSEPEHAILDYTRAIELAPDFDLAYLYRATLYEDHSDIGLAEADFLRALELSPNLAEAHTFYSYFVDRADADAALEHIEQAVRLSECDGGFEVMNIDCASEYLEWSYLQGSNPARRAETAVQAIRFYPHFSYPYFLAACGYAVSGDLKLARDYAQKYLDFPEWSRDPPPTEASQRIVDGSAFC